MTRTSPPQVAFSSGEIDPLLHRRFDYQRFQTGLAACRGFLPLSQGGITRAPGSWFKGRTKTDQKPVLIPFQFAVNDAVVLEFTPNLVRVWRYGSLILAGAVPYELATPYGAVALQTLRWVQSADVIYLADGIRPVQRLARYALDNWTITPQVYDTGPFRVQNLDVAKTLTPSGVSGAITLTASAALFSAAHVGSLLQILPTQDNIIPDWSPSQAVVVGDKRRYGGNYYQLTLGTNTLLSPPIHTEGEAMPALGVKWLWLSDGIGVVRITAFTSPTLANATVIRPLSPALAATATYRYAEGAWSEVYGYPSALELYQQRLAAAATPSEPRTIWFSAVGDFADFAPSIEADGSFAFSIAGDGSVNKVINLRRGRAGLHIFALGEEYSSRSDSRMQVIGPTTAVFGLDGSAGSSPARPIAPAGNPIFISRDRRRLLLVAYNFQSDSNEVKILSRPAQHLGQEEFLQVVWQASPEPLAWLRRGNGDLAAMIYDEAEEILGWAVVPVAGGFVEALAVSPDPDGRQDIVTMAVRRRMPDGSDQRFVEEHAIFWVATPDDTPLYQANHLFCAVRFDADPPTDSFMVPHLAGLEVQAWTETGTYGPIIVKPSGQAVLAAPVRHAVIGLLDGSHRALTLDIQAAAADGNAMGRKKRVSAVAFGLHRSVQGNVTVTESNADKSRPAGQRKPLVERPILQGQAVTAVTGVTRLNLPSGLATGQAILIVPVGGAPLTITAMVPQIEEVGG